MGRTRMKPQCQAFGIGATIILPSSSNGGDLNALNENGIYCWGQGGVPNNAPFNRGAVIHMRISGDGSEAVQLAFSSKATNTKLVQVRWKYSATNMWDVWQSIAVT